MARWLSSPVLRHTATAVSVASIALLGASVPAAAAPDRTAAATIDTYTDWDGVSALFPFGNPQTSTYGQVITIPDGKKSLKHFTFYLADKEGTGTLTLRGEVYGWDGTMATTKEFQSRPKHLDLVAGDPSYTAIKIKTKKTKVTAGEQYVIFLSISKDYEDNPAGVLAKWATNYADVLPGGYTVYQSDNGDESQWTTVPWDYIAEIDFALKATLK